MNPFSTLIGSERLVLGLGAPITTILRSDWTTGGIVPGKFCVKRAILQYDWCTVSGFKHGASTRSGDVASITIQCCNLIGAQVMSLNAKTLQCCHMIGAF